MSLPHFFATAFRCWRLRAHVDRGVLVRFGLWSALGGLLGALLYTRLGTPALTRVLGGLLVLTALAQLTRWTEKLHPRGPTVPLLGWGSGLFGGLAGNQGGLRSAALTAFALPPRTFVATATAVGVLVDLARTPVYLWKAGPDLLRLWPPIAVATVGVLIGTVVGEKVLFGLSSRRFAQIVGVAVGALGLWLLVAPT